MKKSLYFAIIALLAFTGCGKDYLNEAPILSQSSELSLKDLSHCDLAVAGAYSPLASTTWYGQGFILTNEMRTSDAKKWIGGNHDTGRLNNDYNIVYTPNSTSGLWGLGYFTISAVNNVIDQLPNVNGTEQEKNNLKAECLFLRALSHFDMVRTYAMPYNYTADASHLGVPVVLHTDAQAAPSRNTVKEVYDQVIADLAEAEKIIDPNYSRKGVTDSKAVVTLPAIQALLSRVYLYCGKWQLAADEATKVIASKKYTMWTKTDLKDAKAYRQDAPTAGEIIFEVYGAKANAYDGYWDGLTNMTASTGSYGDGGASPELQAIYEDTDVRKTLFATDDKGECLFTTKYAGKGVATPDLTNTIVLRLSEMYLNRAEAIINGATVSGVTATADLTEVASMRGATTQPATKTGVYLERQKELAWEGQLWFDLARTGRASIRSAADFVGTATSKDVEVGSYKWAMPIPQREINVNPSIKQNEGY